MMHNPLRYQLSEYDCGPTAVLNGISFLFPREAIPPEIIRNTMLYCLDCYNAEGIQGKSGTSAAAMVFLTNWLNGFGKIGQLPISAEYLSDRSVYIGQGGRINDCLHHGGVAVVRLFFDEPHYVLLTGEENGIVQMFDPYYVDQPFKQKDILLDTDHPCEYNRIVPAHYFNQESEEIYSLGPTEGREAVLLFNEETRLTPEKTIEYFI